MVERKAASLSIVGIPRHLELRGARSAAVLGRLRIGEKRRPRSPSRGARMGEALRYMKNQRDATNCLSPRPADSHSQQRPGGDAENRCAGSKEFTLPRKREGRSSLHGAVLAYRHVRAPRRQPGDVPRRRPAPSDSPTIRRTVSPSFCRIAGKKFSSPALSRGSPYHHTVRPARSLRVTFARVMRRLLARQLPSHAYRRATTHGGACYPGRLRRKVGKDGEPARSRSTPRRR